MVSSVVCSEEAKGFDVHKQSDNAPGLYMEANAGYLLRGRKSQGSEPIQVHPILYWTITSIA